MFFPFGILIGLVAGYLLSFIDIRWFISELLNVSKIKNKISVVLVLCGIGVIFYIFFIIPGKKILHSESTRYFPAQQNEKQKKVSMRLELKRRGSWPVAYSNKSLYSYPKEQ